MRKPKGSSRQPVVSSQLWKRTQFRGVKCAKRTQFGWSAGGPERETCKTNAISTCRARGMASRWQISTRKIRILSSVDKKLIVIGGKLGWFEV